MELVALTDVGQMVVLAPAGYVLAGRMKEGISKQ
jgi:hypothetical protein